MRIKVAQLLAAAAVALRVSAAPSVPEDSGVFDYRAPEPGSYQLPVIKPAPGGLALDSRGRTVRLRELTRGRVTVLSFIYTRCAAARACPYATGVLRDLHQRSAADPELASNLRLVSMSFDPGYDTPKTMAAYAALAEGRPSAAEWRFVTARSEAELEPVLRGYGQAVDRKKDPASPGGPFNHVLRVFLIDREGRIRNIYSSATLDLRLVLADVKTLLLEPHPLSGAPKHDGTEAALKLATQNAIFWCPLAPLASGY